MIYPFEAVKEWWFEEGWKERFKRKDQLIPSDCGRMDR